MIKKGIILAGGAGSRLYPMTAVVTKQLLPIYNKPLIFYPLATLMTAGIREILVISQATNIPLFQKLLGNGDAFGISISYEIQDQPNGIAEAFLVGERFLDGNGTALILGDNIFFGNGLEEKARAATQQEHGATIFGYQVHDPERYGVATLAKKTQKVVAIHEKPSNPESNLAVTGLYFYDNTVVQRAKSLKPSARGELEITDLNNTYIQDSSISLQILDTGIAWLDTGTFESMLQASQFVEVLETRQGIKIACLEEIAYRQNWISEAQLLDRIEKIKNSPYADYLRLLISTKLMA